MSKLNKQIIAESDWGSAFIKEADLVIANAIHSEMVDGAFVYNETLNLRVADFCRPLDGGATDEYLGVIHVPPNTDDPYKRFDDVFEMVRNRQRGTWAILEADGKYDAIMSDGHGSLGRLQGNAFAYASPDAGTLNARALYAGVVGWFVYNERGAVKNQIVDNSLAVADIQPGRIAKNVTLSGVKYSTVEYVGIKKDHSVSGADAYNLKLTRRGVAPVIKPVRADHLLGIFEIKAMLPEHLVPADGIDRSVSLMELRQQAAQKAWLDYVMVYNPEVASRNTTSMFDTSGDSLVRRVYTGDILSPVPCGRFVVEFREGTYETIGVRLDYDTAAPAP